MATPPSEPEPTYQPASFDMHATNKPVADLPSLLQPDLPQEAQERLQSMQATLTTFKDKLLTKFEGYIAGVALLPPAQKKEGEETNPNAIRTLVLIDDTDSTKMSKEELREKLSNVITTMAKDVDPNIAVELYLYTDVWNNCYDSKYDLIQLFALAQPVYDNGMLAGIKIAEIHKTMVLKKFEKYIVSYVLAGSLVQGKSTHESDIDVFIVIDDTDVKKMSRFELKDRLRSIIYDLAHQASDMTGIKKQFQIQTYILTDFWDSVKEANPVIFTFLRDGVPFFDRGIFMPWKQLLKMGRIRPSPEAVDIYINTGQQYFDRVKLKLKEVGMEDFFWATVYPSQAVLMMHGVPPPTPKELPTVLRDVFVKKEKLLEEKYVKTLEKVLKVRKELEHGTKTTFLGKELDELYTGSQEYLTRINELATQIQKRTEQTSVVNVYDSLLAMMRDCLRIDHITDLKEAQVIPRFLKQYADKGFVAAQYVRTINDVVAAKEKYDKGELTADDVQKIRKAANELSKVLVEFIQRKRGYELERSKILVKYGNSVGEALILAEMAYIIMDIDAEEKELVKAPISPDGQLGPSVEATWDEYEKAVMEAPLPKETFIKETIFEGFKSIFGKDVHIALRR